MTTDEFKAELRRAEGELAARDAVLGRHIERVGGCDLQQARRFRPFEALMSSIAHQQLNGRAASTILSRVKQRLGGGGWPTPERVAVTRLPSLKGCGLSTAKSRAFKDLAAKTLDGTVPGAAALHRMSDGAIIERLTVVRGIGRWTVQMMLMFRLGRLDVLPVDDFGVRKGYARLYGRRAVVTPKQLLASAERWRPWRTVAAWYLWRVLDG